MVGNYRRALFIYGGAMIHGFATAYIIGIVV